MNNFQKNFTYSTQTKIKNKLNDLKKLIIKEEIILDNWEIKQGKYIDFGNYEFKNNWHNLSIGDVWATSGETAFIKKNICIEKPNEYIGLYFDTDGEGLLYVNGEAFHGVDDYRGYICLTQKAKDVEKFDLLFEHKAGGYEDFEDKPINHVFKKASILIIDKEIESIYYDYLVPFDVACHIKDEVIYKFTLNLIYENLLSIDWTKKNIKEDLIKANKIFKEKLKTLPKTPGQIYFIGNSHIDLVFLWPERETHRKVGRTFNSLIKLMEEYPDYYFVASQVPIFEYLKKYYPQTFAKIKELIKANRFEIVGGTYAEHSTNLPSGESLVRQCLYGKKYFQKEFNYNVEIGWLPDTFGFTYSLPQIYKQAGIKTLITQKLRYNDTNSFYEEKNIPELIFNWEGIDGSKILMYNSGSYKHLAPIDMDFMLYNVGYYYNKSNSLPLQDYLAPYGYSDGGGGVHRESLEYIKRLNDAPGFPKVKVGTIKEFVDNLNKENLTNYNNELYMESHRGTYTSQANIKKYHRKCEISLRNVEILGVISNSYNKDKLYSLWQKLLFNEFHDIIPGSSINEGAVTAVKDLKEVLNELNNLIESALNKLSNKTNGKNIFVFNPLSFKNKSLACVESDYDYIIKDSENNIVPSSFSNNKLYFIANMDGFSGKTYSICEETKKEETSFIIDKSIETPYYSIEFSEDGYISKIYDKINKRNVINEKSNVFQAFYDKSSIFDAWDIDVDFEKNQVEWTCVQKPKLKEFNSLMCVFESEYKYNNSTIKQDMILYSNSHRIDFKTKVNWQEDHILLKVAFYPNIRANEATYEIPYGSIKRPTTRNNNIEKAKFEACGHRWADISEPDYGVSILNDCKYGWDIKDNQMRLTLLKSPKWPDATCDIGEHEFTYSLFPHKSCLLEDTIKEAHILNNPLYVYKTNENKNIESFVKCSDNVIIDCIKKAEDDDSIIVRLYEPYGNRGEVTLTFANNINNVSEVNILEEEIDNTDLINNSVKFNIKPFEIKTFKIIFN